MAPLRLLLLPLSLALGACHDDRAGSGAPAAPEPAATTLTVVPSLGRIDNAMVTLQQLGGDWQAAGMTDGSGNATFTIPGGMGPMLVSVCLDSGSRYYDEALDIVVDPAPGLCLRAVLPAANRAAVGVTALTEAAVRRLEQQAPLADAGAAEIAAALEFVRSRVLPEVADLLQAPATVGSAADLAALPLDDSGRYALKLAALAGAALDLAATRGGSDAPAAEIGAYLADDLADGAFDGNKEEAFLVSNVYDIHHLPTLLASRINALGAQGGNLAALVAGLAGQELLADVTPAAGSAFLLSWQGNYSGTWTGAYSYPGSMTGSALLSAFRAQLVDDGPCTLAINAGDISIGGLPYGFALDRASAADEDGYREYEFSRLDNVTVFYGGMALTVPITSSARVVTRAGQVLRVDMLGESNLGGIRLIIGEGSCEMPQA